MDDRAPAAGQRLAIRFDNDGRERVHVYLVGERREWLLGRVAPGATAWLPLPLPSLADGPFMVRLAVLTGAPVSIQAASDARATFTLAQPATALLERRWSYTHGELISLRKAERP